MASIFLAYFLPEKCMKADEIVTLLKDCLDRLNGAGADVQFVTCDQGTCNQSAYAAFNPQQPFFTHNGRKYNASYDFPHLVKRLASFLRTHENIYCDGEIIASYSDFVTTWTIDNATKGGSNLLSHITEAHIRPNTFEAMNVKKVFQLFSHTFAAAIKTLGCGNELHTNSWKATANFAERMNTVIDACNAYSFKVTFGGKRLLSAKNPDIEDLLTNFVQWCSKWSKSSTEIKQVPCFKGFALTVRAILYTYKELASKYEVFELATGLYNQDSVEHLFSKLRQRGGFNPNPTARMVRLSIRHILSTGYIQTSDKGNVQYPENESLINEPSRLIKRIEKSMNTSDVTENEVDPETQLLETDVDILEKYDENKNIENMESLSNYDENVITYFAGFAARRCFEKTNCKNCRDVMMKTPMDDQTANEKYIEFREYSNTDEDAPAVTKLIRPTTLFTNIVKIQLMTFSRTWQCYWASSQVLDNIVKRMYTCNE